MAQVKDGVDLVITLDLSFDNPRDIEWTQILEKELDCVLEPLGYKRYRTSKLESSVEIGYGMFGRCL